MRKRFPELALSDLEEAQGGLGLNVLALHTSPTAPTSPDGWGLTLPTQAEQYGPRADFVQVGAVESPYVAPAAVAEPPPLTLPAAESAVVAPVVETVTPPPQDDQIHFVVSGFDRCGRMLITEVDASTPGATTKAEFLAALGRY